MYFIVDDVLFFPLFEVTRRISCLSSPDKLRNSEGSVTMYGARCISSVAKGETSDGLIYGHGSITLMLVFRSF